MGALTAVARALRLDPGTWRWLDSDASLTGAALVVIGTYLVLAFDRFGWPDLAIRASARVVLIGFYGWVWLAVASWAIVRLKSANPTSLAAYLRLTGHAHLPILVIAVFLAVFPVTLNVAFIGWLPALLAATVWMPAMLVRAVSTLSGLGLGRAAAAAALPYAAWLVVVGTYMFRQVEHLL